MDFIEQGGNALDLVEHDDARWRESLKFQAEQRGIREEGLISVLVEEIDAVRRREGATSPGALPDPSHPI